MFCALRLAKSYLASVIKESGVESDDESAEPERVSAELEKRRLLKQGSYYRAVADQLRSAEGESCINISRNLCGHKHAVTCVALSSDDSKIYSGSKDNSVVEWDTETGAKTFVKLMWSKDSDTPSRDSEVLSVAVSSDGRYICSGGRDSFVRVFDTRARRAEVSCFRGHRGAVTCLSFRRDTYSLFSGSIDRCVKHWDLNEMGYLETCFGHQVSYYCCY